MARYPSITSYNLTQGWLEIPNYVNDVTNSVFSIMLLIAIFIIVTMGVFYYSRKILNGLSVGGFITALVGTIFWWGGLISGVMLGFTYGVAFVCFALLWIIGHND